MSLLLHQAGNNEEPLQLRLARLLIEDTVVCDVAVGAVGPCLLELFERIKREVLTMTPGALLTARVRAIGRVLPTLQRRLELLNARCCRAKGFTMLVPTAAGTVA